MKLLQCPECFRVFPQRGDDGDVFGARLDKETHTFYCPDCCETLVEETDSDPPRDPSDPTWDSVRHHWAIDRMDWWHRDLLHLVIRQSRLMGEFLQWVDFLTKDKGKDAIPEDLRAFISDVATTCPELGHQMPEKAQDQFVEDYDRREDVEIDPDDLEEYNCYGDDEEDD